MIMKVNIETQTQTQIQTHTQKPKEKQSKRERRANETYSNIVKLLLPKYNCCMRRWS